MKAYGMQIDGRRPRDHGFLDVRNPATGEPFARMQCASVDDVHAAVAAARRAFPAWSSTADAERQRLLRALGELISANLEELRNLVTLETGKPVAGLNGIGSTMEVGGAAAWVQATADFVLPPEVIQQDTQESIVLHRRPLGVVASITPWNWPLILAIWHVAPALRAGNTVVMKSSEYTPIATSRFVELANTVLPPGVLNLVAGAGEVGSALCEHPGVDKIIFTGSTRTGRGIMRTAASSLKRLTLELGGNDAGIVLPDVDVDDVAPRLLGACLHNNGQTCAALKRLYVHEDIHDAVCEAMAAIARRLVVGDGMDPKTELGPLQNAVQLEIVSTLAADARARGATFLCGGGRARRPGYFFPPTIVTGLSEGARLVDEEQFGPLVPVLRFRDTEEVIARANASPSGLGGSVWSKDIAEAQRIAARLECGTVWINDHAAIRPDVPFGGIKQSGFGLENGRLGLEEVTRLQVMRTVVGVAA
jgi:acyl-CoA reductase-like NAD-dependent aldehyde dehydrogenase